MESIKMVLMNLFVGQQRRCRHKEQTLKGRERLGRLERVVLKHIHYNL